MELFVQALNAMTGAIQHNDIKCVQPTTNLPDGTKICCDPSGVVIFAHYSSGVKLIRHDDYVMCSNDAGEQWFGDRHNRWFKID